MQTIRQQEPIVHREDSGSNSLRDILQDEAPYSRLKRTYEAFNNEHKPQGICSAEGSEARQGGRQVIGERNSTWKERVLSVGTSAG